MRVEYTLPGLLPEAAPTGATEAGERPAEAFGAHLRQLRAPDTTDWRDVLRLNAPLAGAAHIGPPPAPHGIDARDGASQRAWWRNMLRNHVADLESVQPESSPGTEANAGAAVQRMLGLLTESQRSEDEVFARHFAESED